MRILKMLGFGILMIFAVIGISSTFSVTKQILVDGMPENSLYKTYNLEPNVQIIPELAKGSAAITIGSETKIINDVFIILVEKKKGEVEIFSSKKVYKFNDPRLHSSQNEEHNPEKISNHSVENLMLQFATGSSNAHAAICCTGPYTNANGDIVARSCVKKNSACY